MAGYAEQPTAHTGDYPVQKRVQETETTRHVPRAEKRQKGQERAAPAGDHPPSPGDCGGSVTPEFDCTTTN